MGKAAAKISVLNGSFYVAIGFIPDEHTFTGYKSAVVSYREPKQRKDRKVSIAPVAYRNKEDVIAALNDVMKFLEEN